MENDYEKEIVIIDENKLIFKLEHSNQKIENNLEIKIWKNIMQEKYGKNKMALFRCTKDCILFFYKISYEFNLEMPIICGKCPLCQYFICPFCSYHFKTINNSPCCIKRSIYKQFYFNGFIIIKNYSSELQGFGKIIYIPGLNLFILIVKIIKTLYLNLLTKESLNNYNEKSIYYWERFKNNGIIYSIFIGFIIAIASLLSIVYLFYNAVFLLFLFIISIPCNYYLLNYYYGLLIFDELKSNYLYNMAINKIKYWY